MHSERLAAKDGSTPKVLGFEKRSQKEEVFNIEVDGDHVYRVGEQGLLVHNASANPNFEEACSIEPRCPTSYYSTYKKVPNHPLYLELMGKLPQGIRVYLKDPLPTGQKATLNPPGWDSSINVGKSPPIIARGHILAKSLGGKNKLENLFTICHQNTNTPWMKDSEVEIGSRISSRKEEWYYEVDLGYSGAGLIPRRIKIRGCTEQKDTAGKSTGLIYRTAAWLWDTGILNEAGETGIASCKGAT